MNFLSFYNRFEEIPITREEDKKVLVTKDAAGIVSIKIPS